MTRELEQSESNQGSIFSVAFAPRVLDVRFSSCQAAGDGHLLDVRVAHFNRIEGKFQEEAIEVQLEGGRITRIDSPLIVAREFQQALKRYYVERFINNVESDSSHSGEVPRQIFESLLQSAEGHLAQRHHDEQKSSDLTNDRSREQKDFQERDRWQHDLVVLGRYHRRRGDFVGGAVEGMGGVAYGFTTGAEPSGYHVDPNEDALGIDRIGDLGLFLIADAHHGQRSSELAVSKVLELFRLGFAPGDSVDESDIHNFLVRSIVRCHLTIQQDLQAERSKTSLVVAICQSDRLYWASVSDSFLFRIRDEQIGKVNHDLGHGIIGKNRSIFLGDREFHEGLIDSGIQHLNENKSCLLFATDGILKHRQLGLRAQLGSVDRETNLEVFSHRISRDYARYGRDNAAFILLRKMEDSVEQSQNRVSSVHWGSAFYGDSKRATAKRGDWRG